MHDLKSRYNRLSEKINSASVDYGRATIYCFEKYCKHCGQGLKKPNPWDRRTMKKLFKVSFCSDAHLEKGERPEMTFPLTVKSSPPNPKNRKESLVEEMAFIALEMQKEQEKLSPLLRLIHEANRTFRLLSEKLRFLELETGEQWGPSKYYFWVAKI